MATGDIQRELSEAVRGKAYVEQQNDDAISARLRTLEDPEATCVVGGKQVMIHGVDDQMQEWDAGGNNFTQVQALLKELDNNESLDRLVDEIWGPPTEVKPETETEAEQGSGPVGPVVHQSRRSRGRGSIAFDLKGVMVMAMYFWVVTEALLVITRNLLKAAVPDVKPLLGRQSW